MRHRLLAEELPLASLHKMNSVHTRSYRGYCCLDAILCTRDLSTGERAETPRSHALEGNPDAVKTWIASSMMLDPSKLDLVTYQTMVNRGHCDALAHLVHEAKKQSQDRCVEGESSTVVRRAR